jgi:hypothetical protein
MRSNRPSTGFRFMYADVCYVCYVSNLPVEGRLERMRVTV